jgi:hypothetical protein
MSVLYLLNHTPGPRLLFSTFICTFYLFNFWEVVSCKNLIAAVPTCTLEELEIIILCLNCHAFDSAPESPCCFCNQDQIESPSKLQHG